MRGRLKRGTPAAGWPDDHLVDACLAGRDQAWNALVDKYKNLVFSIALKYGIARDEAADLFQWVWIDVYNGLEKLRKKGSLKPWLISLTLHRCYHWVRAGDRRSARESGNVDAEQLAGETAVAPAFLEELERNQLVHESITELTPRCQEMIRLLFFSFPPKPYREVAERLGLAVGSIGFTRGRCLTQLRDVLVKKGV